MTRYILDANAFVQAKNLHYGIDVCPAFWEWLDRAKATDVATSVEKVADELEVADDDLAAWLKARRDTFFLSPDVEVGSVLDRVSDRASSSGYESSAVTIFLQVADYRLIVYAFAHNCVVVTHEIPRRYSQKDQYSKRISCARVKLFDTL